MTVSRADIAEHLNSQFSSFASAIGQADSDDGITGYGPDIDLALRRLGKARSELTTATVEDSQDEAVFALAEYFAARRLWRHMSSNINFTADGSVFSFQYTMAAVKALMDDAKAECQALGYDVSSDGWSVGWLNLDFLEPESAL
ncbi:MAG: hypothetical protein ACTS5I_00885 [Rhodanobacter sp.]